MTEDELQKAILNGISFKKAPKKSQDNIKAVKTKAKKKAYITGSHGSGAAKMKAKIREKRMERHKK